MATSFLLQYIILLITILSASSLEPEPIISKPTGDIQSAVLASTHEITCDIKNPSPDIQVQWQFYKCTGQENLTCTFSKLISKGKVPDDEQQYSIRFTGLSTYVLGIKHVAEKHEEMYYCIVPLTRVATRSDTIMVKVIELPSIDPMGTSSDVILEEGDPMHLMCKAFGRPAPIIVWERVGRGLLPNGGTRSVGEVLSVHKMKGESAGPYICHAYNEFGETSRVISVKVLAAPIVRATPAVVEQMEGYKAKLICNVDADPAADSMNWLVDGRSVSQDTRYEVSTLQAALGQTIMKLMVNVVRIDDFNREFTCTATNFRGSSHATVHLQKSDQPRRVEGQLQSVATSCKLQLQLLVISVLLVTASR